MLGKKLNTVDEVLSKFSTAIFELENLSDLNDEEAGKQLGIIESAEHKVKMCMEEKKKADRIKAKLQDLLA